MQSWLNWYSIGLENRHSERISGFESLALRYAYVVKRLRQRTATPRPLVRFQPYAYARMVKLEDTPDLGRKASGRRLFCADRNGV